MAVRDLEVFLRQRAGIFDPGLDVTPGSPFDSAVIQPLIRRLGTDPFTIDLSTFLYERINQAFPDIAINEGDAIVDLLIKPMTLLWDPIVREIQRVRQGQSFRDASQLTTEEAEALGANIFADRNPGQFARGPVRIFFSQPQNISVTPVNFVSGKTGLHYFPTETQSIRTEEMLLNVADDGTYYFDINVIAEAAGVEYNIEPNSLASIANLPSVVRVANLRRFTFGEDDENAQDFIARAEGELTERSLVTLRGISAKITKAFPEVRRLNVVGFNDPEMQRDILRGGGLGDLLGAGNTGFVDDDGEGQAHSRRFGILLTEADFVALTTVGDASSYVLTIFNAFDDGSFAKDLPIKAVLPNDGSLSRVDLVDQVLVFSTAVNLVWILRRRTLTLSEIPGGIIFPQGPLGTVTVDDDAVHIGGTTDVHVGGTAFDQATLVLDDLADNEPELTGTDAAVTQPGSDFVVELGSHVLGTDYLVTDPLFLLFQNAGRNGMTLQLLDGANAGIYRVVSAAQVIGVPTRLTTDPAPPNGLSAAARWKLLGDINVQLTDPRETIVTGIDLSTVQGLNVVTTASATDFSALSVLTNFVLRILDGPDAGDIVITAVPTPTQLQLARPMGSTGANIRYEVFRPNLDGAMSMPLVRIDTIELLDSSSQPIGTTIPYAKPVDIQSRAFQNPARGIKLDIRDARLGVVSLPVGVEATGSITNPGQPNILDGETFVLNDGTNAPVTFEFDKDGVWLAGHVRIDISLLSTATQVRDAIVVAINGVGSSLRIQATASGSATTDLLNVVPGLAGTQAITDTVVDPGFTHTGMSGGADGVYGVTGGDTLNLSFQGFENQPPSTVVVTFSTGPLTLADTITAINTAINLGLSVPNGAVPVGVDRFGIRPLRAGLIVTGGSARIKLFGIDEDFTSWDVRSDTVNELGGWADVTPTLDLDTGIDVVQVLDGQQVGFYSGPYFVPTPTDLRILDVTAPIPVSSSRFAPETNVHVQVGSRSIGSVRCFFLEPTSIEFDQNSRFSVDTVNGPVRFLPDPSLTSIRIPPPPTTAKPTDGLSSGGGTALVSGSQDFVRAGIQHGDILNIDFLPLSGNVSLADPVVNAAGKTLVYSIDNQPDRTLTLIRDSLSLPTTDVSRAGVVDQINASVGRTIAALDGSNHLIFTADVSFVIRKQGTGNTLLLGQRLGLPIVPRYDFSLVDQNNDSPHKGTYRIDSVLDTVLTIEGLLPGSGDFTDPVTNQSFTVERQGVQRISTTEMALNTVAPSLFFFDVELVSEGTGDHFNIDSALQLTATGFRSDGYYLTTDNENLSFSTAELPRLVFSPTILENGVSDTPVNATQLTGHNLQITYDRSQLVEDVNSFMGSEVERVINESPLGRHLIPHFVRFSMRYVSGSTADLVTQDVETYLNDLAPNQAIESSDLQKICSDRGADSIQNPIDLLAVVHYPDRTIYIARSQNALTTGRLAAFIPDILDIQRNTA